MSIEVINTLLEDYSISSKQMLLKKRSNDFTGIFIKKIIDILIAFVGFIIFSPIILLTMILIKIESPGPSLYIQERVGQGGKRFNILKIRSMYLDAELDGAVWAAENDTRVTKIGRFIRKTRIDELPQFINVLKGEMSLIGPRPERPIFLAQFSQVITNFDKRLLVKPGITGWAQINGGYNSTPEQKLQLDLHYINNYSLWLDLRIILKTFQVIFTGDGAR